MGGVSPEWVKSRRRRKKEKKCHAREFPRSGWKAEGVQKEEKKKKKVGENNCQLRFVRHHEWRTQTRLDQKKEEERKKVDENNGQFRFRPPPQVAHASRLDQLTTLIYCVSHNFLNIAAIICLLCVWTLHIIILNRNNWTMFMTLFCKR